jgi:hypothetical protein
VVLYPWCFPISGMPAWRPSMPGRRQRIVHCAIGRIGFPSPRTEVSYDINWLKVGLDAKRGPDCTISQNGARASRLRPLQSIERAHSPALPVCEHMQCDHTATCRACAATPSQRRHCCWFGPMLDRFLGPYAKRQTDRVCRGTRIRKSRKGKLPSHLAKPRVTGFASTCSIGAARAATIGREGGHDGNPGLPAHA